MSWESFKVAFRSKSNNRKKYFERRQPIVDAFTAVKAILERRGSGDLPEDALEDIAEEYASQYKAMDKLDQLSLDHPGRAFIALPAHVKAAEQLLADAKRDRESVEGRQRVKRQDRERYEEFRDLIKGRLETMKAQYALVPDVQSTMDTAQNLADEGRTIEAFSRLNNVGILVGKLSGAWNLIRTSPIPKTASEKEKQELTALKKKVVEAVGAADANKAEAAADQYRTALAQLDRPPIITGLEGADPDARYPRLMLRISDVVEYPDDLASPAVKAYQKDVRDANTAYKDSEKLFLAAKKTHAELDESSTQRDRILAGIDLRSTRTKALEDLKALEDALDSKKAEFAAHGKHSRAYYEELKPLKVRITLAEQLPKTDTGGDTAWKAEREAYDDKKTELKNAVDKPTRNYALGRQKLGELKTCIDDLVEKKLTALDTKVTNAHGDGIEAYNLVVDLLNTPRLITEMSGEAQLKILEGLRTKAAQCSVHTDNYGPHGFSCPDCGDDSNVVNLISTTEMKAARIRIFRHMEEEPTFNKWDQDKREKTIDGIRELDLYKEANQEPESPLYRTQWALWTSDPDRYEDKILGFFNKILETQCKILGHNDKGLTNPNTGKEYKGLPVTIELKAMPLSDFAECAPWFPTTISLNKDHPQFSDLKEMVDTVVHENSHAWQEYMISLMTKREPFDGAEYNQRRTDVENNSDIALHVKLLIENDETYILNDSKAYRHEPIEEQAWNTGAIVSKTLLVPPPVESFESKRTLRSKTFFVESITKATNAKIKLRTRHGIYVDEWEGEKASDKELVLESLFLANGTKAADKDVRIVGVVDEFTLKLNLDTSAGYRLKEGDATLLACDAAKLRLSEEVADV